MNILQAGMNLGQMLLGPQLEQLPRDKPVDRDVRGAGASVPGSVEAYPRGRGGARYLQAQMLSVEIEYQATRLLRRENGETVLERTRVHLQAVEAYAEAGRQEPAEEHSGLEGYLRGRFGPLQVARRIADVALDRFAGDAGDRNQRSAFGDRAKGTVREGVDEAMRTLRGLPGEIRGLSAEIYQVVERILDQFERDGGRGTGESDRPTLARPSVINGTPEARVQFSQVSLGVSIEQSRVDLVA